MENSQDGSLGTLTSLIQHFGLACFPVTDVQSNIRGYANTSGVQSAYAYYPYGTLIDLAHDDAEDSRRWQAKEFDSDLNKYYFGARLLVVLLVVQLVELLITWEIQLQAIVPLMEWVCGLLFGRVPLEVP